ncbi:hypothetical protein, partial [Thermomicrobium sp.]
MTFSAPAIAAPCTAFIPTPPVPKMATVSPGSHACPVDGRTPAGGHRTADQAGAIEREIGIDLDHRVDGTDGVLAEGRDECELRNVLPVLVETEGPIELGALSQQNTAIAERC